MKIIQFEAENVKRLSAVHITPTGDSIIKIGGVNGAGKTSVLDAIAMAIGGKDLVPDEPLRAGEVEGFSRVDLGEYVATRRFRREQVFPPGTNIVKKTDGTLVGTDAEGNPVQPALGPTNSTLTVTTKDGAKYAGPQTLLDKLHSDITFNPLAFADLDPKAQRDLLAKIAGLDFADLDTVKVTVTSDRTLANRDVKRLMDQVAGMPHFPDAPAEEVSVVELSERLQMAQLTHDAFRTATEQLAQADNKMSDKSRAEQQAFNRIQALKEQLRDAETAWQQAVNDTAAVSESYRVALNHVEETKTKVTDTTPIRQALKDSTDVNAKVRANKARAAKAVELNVANLAAEALNGRLRDVEAERAARLAAAKFPIAGLALDEDCVRYCGTRFDQLSTAEQLRVSTAIGLALNPTIKVLLIPRGNVLDARSLAMLGKMADEADAQIWMEWVSETAEGVTVLIEDGHVA
ncbi:MAG: AAA family ATPase [Bryobacteraceae bacterium]